MIVVKVGGSLLSSGAGYVMDDLASISSRSGGLVVVHGGAAEVSAFTELLGKKPVFVVSPSGMRSRYTDRETVEIYQMVMAGKLNKRVVAMLQSRGVNALGLCGVDGMLVSAQRKERLLILDERGRRRVIDGGYTGGNLSVNGKLLFHLIKGGYCPVVAPVAVSEEFDPLNVDSDSVASRIAVETKAEALVLMTNVDGLLVDGELLPSLPAEKAVELRPKIGHGMMRKVHAALEAVSNGVPRAVIANGLVERPVSRALEGKGTIIHG
ncbi:MAG: [LysW]-aminoadipate/[LysW]-glutamate kinase [Candidatus Brockarchaeota archaeon]|nr:[LysW]-aminoadipate/[LysW]-glutamate kinase [Candidatus Brockarchaeota archaeon]